MDFYVEYFSTRGDEYLEMLFQHLYLCAVTLLLAAVLGAAFGMLTMLSDGVYRLVTGIFNTLRIIPSLAVLVFLIPVMGVGTKPALVALTFLSVPPVLIQTSLGLHKTEPFLVESAQAMGMSDRRIFWKVKVPMAVPYFMTGLKTAASEVIASATLAAYIGSGGLGVIIYNGISLMKTEYLLIGGVSVALLTLAANALLGWVQKKVCRWV
ncbi:MAG: ABC transporter permease [Lachnospiraceae bacterium]|nr:ABC transporter permease [Lachnospiraceae bacterium]MDD7025296.1 ABC transporter permease [Oscillospiraceae bacterium]